MRLWKRPTLNAVFGGKLVFADPPARAIARARASGRRLMVWAGKVTPALAAAGAVRIEDGFVRSRGLGAALVPPLSLVADDLGIYYDPTGPSRLEQMIAAAVDLGPDARARAARLRDSLVATGLTKYNLQAASISEFAPGKYRILVPGQVEDDASIRLGAGAVCTNRGLLQAARAAHPGAVILYKPHPDVEAGLRPGLVADATRWADVVLTHTGADAAIAAADAIWTMTSALGFEALIRGKPVTCLGQPFYAGWGLTEDHGAPLPRRKARPDLIGLIHAVLIDYPRYRDPVTGLPCPAEVIVGRLARGQVPAAGPVNRSLSKLQGALASFAHLWR
jgi:capsular polysaccharide export protein